MDKRTPLVDPEDRDLLEGTWSHNARGYAQVYFAGRTIGMHRVVAERAYGPPPFDGCHVDHINRDRLDNRRSNLRYLTPARNARRGGGIDQRRGGFRARGWLDNAEHYLGTFKTREAAEHALQDFVDGLPLDVCETKAA